MFLVLLDQEVSQSPGISIPPRVWVSLSPVIFSDLLAFLFGRVPVSVSKAIKGSLVLPSLSSPFTLARSNRTIIVLVDKHLPFLTFPHCFFLFFLQFTLLTLGQGTTLLFLFTRTHKAAAFSCRSSFWTEQSRLFTFLTTKTSHAVPLGSFQTLSRTGASIVKSPTTNI